jgi:signal transduction histidine kinase
MEAQSRQTIEWAAVAQEMIHNRVKNPLGTIVLAIRRVQQDLEERAGERKEQNLALLDTIASEVARMDESCRTFLRFARLRETSMETVDPAGVVSRVETRVRGGFRDDHRFEVAMEQELPALHADSEQIEWMLENLISNARHALKENSGAVSLRVYSRDKISPEGEKYDMRREIVFEVIDTGIGIPEEHQEKIFDPFFTSRPGGSGLGLAIVRQIVEIHGGEIDVESDPGLGTRFTVQLPAGE